MNLFIIHQCRFISHRVHKASTYILLRVELHPYIYCRNSLGKSDIQITIDYEMKLKKYYVNIIINNT